jgi:hypothetical protein
MAKRDVVNPSELRGYGPGMPRSRRSSTLLFLTSLLSPILCPTGLARAAPAPGDVFREHVWTVGPGDRQRQDKSQHVSDSAATGLAAKRLPNGKNKVVIDNLAGATRAEVDVEVWHAHRGLETKSLRVNGHEWLRLPDPPIPDARGRGGRVGDYLYASHLTVAVPLAQLREGENVFELDAKGGRWPLFVLYGATFRVYFGAGKPHPAARLSAPARGAALEPLARFSIDAPRAEAIARVEYLGRYEDFNYKGDGRHHDWQYRLVRGERRHHVGTATSAPFEVTWDTSWLPDQSRPMELAAIVTDRSGTSFMTRSVKGVRLRRPDRSVKLYRAYDVPQDYKGLEEDKANKVRVPLDPARATAARLFLSSWSGTEAEGIFVNGQRLLDKIEDEAPLRHKLVELDVPVGLLRRGENTLGVGRAKEGEEKHGIEVLWPGMELKVAYPRHGSRGGSASQARPGQARPGEARPSEARPSEARQ